MAEEPPDRGTESVHPHTSAPADDAARSDFSPRARQAIRARIAQYANDLYDESVRVARRRGSSDVISVSDVERAHDNLGLRPRRRHLEIIGSIGSALFGAALGNTLQIAAMPQVASENALLTFVVGTVGAAMTFYGFARD